VRGPDGVDWTPLAPIGVAFLAMIPCVTSSRDRVRALLDKRKDLEDSSHRSERLSPQVMNAVSPTRRPLTENQLLVLRYARHRKRRRREPFSFAELHAFMRRAKGLSSVPNINRYVNRLVADGLIHRDGRKNAKLGIEPAGERLHDQLVGGPRPS